MAINRPLTEPAHTPAVVGEDFHYYDTHPTNEDLLGESAAQSQLIFYLLKVLEWLYQAENCFIVSNLNIYHQRRHNEYPLAPDVAVFKGIGVPSTAAQLRSWRLYEPNRPAPQVVFEISLQETWREDLARKPAAYAALGVHECYAYEPNDPPYWPPSDCRLRGWWLENEVMIEQPADARGRIWSAELGSWLVADGALMRLYDRNGRARLTEGEAQRATKELAWAKLHKSGIDPGNPA